LTEGAKQPAAKAVANDDFGFWEKAIIYDEWF
jgi:hypothetical protein